MTEINDRHVEWATVHRMREMLRSVRRDYEITQTYTLFTGILCWTLQRIRWEGDDTILQMPMECLRKSLKTETFEQFLRLQLRPRPISQGMVGPLNDLSSFGRTGRHENALDVLIALRDAAAHGDFRNVIPLNVNAKLIGYHFICRPKAEAKFQWKAEVSLDRMGMYNIADRLADRFCDAAIGPEEEWARRDALSLKEVG